jgi:4-hydroxybenzoate polyprenyltransferase
VGAATLVGVTQIRWASVGTVALATAVALVFLGVAIRGRVWAWVPFAIAAGVAIREVRHLQRSRRPPDAGFTAPDRRRRDAG